MKNIQTMIVRSLILASSLAMSSSGLAGDISNAFFPEKGKKIKMLGSLDGKNLTCKNSNGQDCQEIFDKVFDAIEGQYLTKRTIKGTMKEEGKKLKKVTFTTETETIGGKEVRSICEYDAKTKEHGAIWVDPAEADFVLLD